MAATVPPVQLLQSSSALLFLGQGENAAAATTDAYIAFGGEAGLQPCRRGEGKGD